MRERLKSNEVIDLSAYRLKGSRTQKPAKPAVPPDKLLDEISYHLLMAARAIAAHTKQ